MMLEIDDNVFRGPPNGYCITRSPDSNAKTRQTARQPGAVKLMRVRRATALGSHDPPTRKAVGFMQELGRGGAVAREVN